MMNDPDLTIVEQLAHTLRNICSNLTGPDCRDARMAASLREAQDALDYIESKGEWSILLAEGRVSRSGG